MLQTLRENRLAQFDSGVDIISARVFKERQMSFMRRSRLLWLIDSWLHHGTLHWESFRRGILQ